MKVKIYIIVFKHPLKGPEPIAVFLDKSDAVEILADAFCYYPTKLYYLSEGEVEIEIVQ
jgi:hypothetical protein